MSDSNQVGQDFVSLLTDHQEVIRSCIISQMPGSSDVRDVLQEVNIVLWKKRNDFELGTNFGAWARSVAHYKIMEHREKKAKHEGLLVFSEDLCRQLASDSQDRGAGELESKRHALAFCLTKLSPENRELLKTRYASSNGGIDRVSAETGRSPASIRVTLFRLRAGLRKCIHSYLVMKGGTL